MLLALAGSAAGAITLRVAAQADGHASATWTLGAGQQAFAIEVATSPKTDDDGLFLDDNVADGDLLDASATSWVSNVQLAPGTYYVHLATYDPVADSAVWSGVVTIVIPTATGPGTAVTATVDHDGRRHDPGCHDLELVLVLVLVVLVVLVDVVVVVRAGQRGRGRGRDHRRAVARTRAALLHAHERPRLPRDQVDGPSRFDPRSPCRLDPAERTEREVRDAQGGESLGETASTAITQRVLRGLPGRWTVQLRIGPRTAATATFVVRADSAAPAAAPAP